MQALQSERVGLAKDGFARINLPEHSPNLGLREAMQAELGLSLGSLPAPSLRREGERPSLHRDLVGQGVVVFDYCVEA